MKTMTRLSELTILLGLLSLGISLASFLVPAAIELNMLVLLCYVLSPILWLLWIGCSLYENKSKNKGSLLILIWLIIDAAILLTLLSAALDDTLKDAPNGAIHIAYAPATFPILVPCGILLVLFSLPTELSIFHFSEKSTIGAALTLWAEPSCWAALQSCIIYGFVLVARWLRNAKRK